VSSRPVSPTDTSICRRLTDPGMRSESEIRGRISALEEKYDAHDPPSSAVEDELEVALLRAIEELEWVLEQREETEPFTG